jgi:hypothetical protein
METRLALSGRHYDELKQHLFPGDGLEAVALLLCGRGRGPDRNQLVGRRVVPVPHDQVIARRSDYVEWPVDQFLLPLVEEMERDDLGVVVVHCHPEGGRFFSKADDAGDQSLFPSVHSWFDADGAHGAAVMLSNGEIIARFVGPDGKFKSVSVVSVAGDDIRLFRHLEKTEPPPFAARVIQTFGQGTYAQLKAIKVAVVGCSGTGSIVIELLARNCVGELVLVDDDRVEEGNLNRIVNSRARHVDAGAYKVEAIADEVREFGLGTRVRTFAATISDPAAARAIAGCDVVFGCVDSVEGRHVLSMLTSAYAIPYFDMGVEIVPDGAGGIENAVADTHYIQPGGSSLMSRGVYTPGELAAEALRRTDPEYYRRQRIAGYLAEVREDRPAVMPLNMMAANGAVMDFLARLHGFRLDPNGDFASQRWGVTHGYWEHGPDGAPCRFMGQRVGLADRLDVSC